MSKAVIVKAIELAGSEKKLGDGIGVSQVAVNKIKHKGRISAELALAVDHFLEGRVSASELRPDMWTGPEHVPPPPGRA